MNTINKALAKIEAERALRQIEREEGQASKADIIKKLLDMTGKAAHGWAVTGLDARMTSIDSMSVAFNLVKTDTPDMYEGLGEGMQGEGKGSVNETIDA